MQKRPGRPIKKNAVRRWPVVRLNINPEVYSWLQGQLNEKISMNRVINVILERVKDADDNIKRMNRSK